MSPSPEDLPPDPQEPFVSIPSTVSPEAQAFLRTLPSPRARLPFPEADDLDGWKRYQANAEAERAPLVEAAMQDYQPRLEELDLGGVPVLEVTPPGWRDNGRVLVYVHGGCYTLFSAHSTITSSALAAVVTGTRVVSVDYTLAPFAKWKQITDEVTAVLNALISQGVAPARMGVFGDSAGGSLAAGAVLKHRDRGGELPAAVALWSPWADITDSGDSAVTLKDAESQYLYDVHLSRAAAAYADPSDQHNPYVSPVYADFSKGFPPTLIQGGTKELFLSHFVRLAQALEEADVPTKLDLYDGMPHVFQSRIPRSPESRSAMKKFSRFLDNVFLRAARLRNVD